MKSQLTLIGSLLLAACAGGQSGTNTPGTGGDAQSVSPPDLTGFWVRTDEVGSGSFGGMFERIPPAELQPQAKAEAMSAEAERLAEEEKLKQASNGVYKTPARCIGPSIDFMMQHSGAIDIVQNKDEVLIIPEHPGTQHIYMDGRGHPSLADWLPSGAGHSIGRYEGDALIVSTIGMTAGGGIPAGGRRSPETELVQRFSLRDPTHLVVSFTWNDPKIYVKPHKYEYTYEKQPEDSYAFESWCDVTDPLQGQSIVIPPKA